MAESNEVRINIGAGKTCIAGFTNIDVAECADITLNMNVDPLPFEDNSVDLVFSNHTIEHLENYLFALGEIHRVMKHGARLLLSVPYVTLTEYNLVNPYHRQHFNEFSFDFFDPEKLLGSAVEPGDILFRKIVHRFAWMPEFANEEPGKREWYRRHCFNVVREIVFGVMAVKDMRHLLPVTSSTAEQMLRDYDHYNNARVLYGDL